MQRRTFVTLIGFAILSPSVALAQDYADDLVRQLVGDGFGDISVTRTLLGRLRVVAYRAGGQREIIINPNTGEILRDLWLVRSRDSGQSGSGRTANGSNDSASSDDQGSSSDGTDSGETGDESSGENESGDDHSGNDNSDGEGSNSGSGGGGSGGGGSSDDRGDDDSDEKEKSGGSHD